MEFKENKAIYLQIADRICDEILLGKFQEDERIPSVREYSAVVEVNVNTVARTFDHLQQQGVIFTKRGLGYFVSQGAKEAIGRFRREEFFNTTLAELVRSMSTLGITTEDVVTKIDEMFNKNNTNTDIL